MSSTPSPQPLTPDRPAPPGQEVEVPDVPMDLPDDRENPDGTAVSAQAGMVEPTD